MIIIENSTFIKVIKFDLVQNSSHELDYLIKIIFINLKYYHFNIFLIKMIYFLIFILKIQKRVIAGYGLT
jgi:hypothetical protein